MEDGIADPVSSIPIGTYVDTTTAQTAAGNKIFSGDIVMKNGRPWYDVRGYGPLDTAVHATATIKAARDAWAATGGTLFFPYGADYTINDMISLPTINDAAFHTFYEIVGWGAQLTMAAGVGKPCIGDPIPANTAAVVVGRKFLIHGLRFNGDGATAGQEGLRIIGSQSSEIDHCGFYGLDIGLDGIFCLGAKATSCVSKSCRTYAGVWRSGNNADGSTIWGDATPSNSASNDSTFEHWRDYAVSGQVAQLVVLGSDGCRMEDCITEGGNPVNAVLFDALGGSSIRAFSVSNHHPENSPSNAHFKVSPSAGIVDIDMGWCGTVGGLFIDGSGGAITAVIHARVPAVVSMPAFKTVVGGPRWVFAPGGNYGADVYTNTAFWAGAVVGTLGGLRFNDATAEAQVPGASMGLAGAAPWLHGTDVFLLSDRTALNVPGVHLTGATEIAVEDNGPVAGVFVANSMACPSLDITNLNMLWTLKFSNGATRFSWLPAVVQNLLGYIFTSKHAAPADGDLAAGEMSIWFDQTNGAAKLMVKAKQADGTVRTGSLALS